MTSESKDTAMALVAVGWVQSPLVDRDSAPKQGDEGAPPAWIVMASEYADAMRDLEVGARVVVLTWLDRADRTVRTTHPRDDLQRPAVGVFNTRSPDRPNPIGLHRVQIVAIDGRRVQVDHLEALDGTPVLDVKPEL
jgi:tRNA-Thr(GGU) m(6)t(6)A37 methyltransferase TsaA